MKGVSEKIEGQIAAFSKERPGWTIHSDPWIRLMTASYCWGFVCGALQVTGADKKWAGLTGADDVGMIAMMGGIFYGVFGENDTMNMIEQLPQARGRKPPEELAMLEHIGGTDGMSMAEYQPSRWPGGGLYHFYVHNVT